MSVESTREDDVLAPSIEDIGVIKLWDKETRFTEGHFEIPIPWREGRPNFPNNFHMASRRLDSLLRKLTTLDLYECYDRALNELLTEGYAEVVPDSEIHLTDGSSWFLPHHAVFSDSKPGKLRIVFDCAAKYNTISLNNQCFQGPDNINKLIHVLLRFREFEYAVTADVKAMYLQVKVPLNDRNALRFLWRRQGEDSTNQFRMTSHLFGGVWCSASSSYALRKSVEQPCSSLVRDTILQNMYVDDMLQSVASPDEAREVVDGSRVLLKQAGFKLTKFVANAPEVLQCIPMEDRVLEANKIKPVSLSTALGVCWDVENDVFLYKCKDYEYEKISKRIILSQLSSMYDPLGLISVIIIKGKIIFQEIVRLKVGWDDKIPPEVSEVWKAWLKSLR